MLRCRPPTSAAALCRAAGEWSRRRSSSDTSDATSAAELLRQLARSRSSLLVLSNGATVRLTLPSFATRIFKSDVDLVNSPLYNPNVKVKTIDDSKLSRFLKKYKGWDATDVVDTLGALPEALPSEVEAAAELLKSSRKEPFRKDFAKKSSATSPKKGK
jgi:hypothetical protein